MKEAPPRSAMLTLPIHASTRFVLDRPHYPENVGAVARAIKTMGFTQLSLVKPSRIAIPSHEMARKMAVKSCDVLDEAWIHSNLTEALAERSLVLATTSRSGVSGVLQPREAARIAQGRVTRGGTIAVVFGNEKTGLNAEDLTLAHERVRIPMAAAQPSVNLAQATQIIAYELFLAALDARSARR